MSAYVSDSDRRIVDRIVEELSLRHGGESAEVAVGGCGIVYVVFPDASYEIAFGNEEDPRVVYSLVAWSAR